MSLFGRVKTFIKRDVLRDKFLLEVKRWLCDRGDETLRLTYPLDKNSIVWDVGGFHGDFAASIHEKYGAIVHVFEPLAKYHEYCETRFQTVPTIFCHPYGLSDRDGSFQIAEDGDASSFLRSDSSQMHIATVRSIDDIHAELGCDEISLMKVNIEGGEYQLLEKMLSSDLVKNIEYIQIQFHDFVPDAKERRDAIRHSLSKTHVCEWCYEFVWESWRRVV